MEVVSSFGSTPGQVWMTACRCPTSSYALRESRITLVIWWSRAKRDTIYLHCSKKLLQKRTHVFLYGKPHMLLCAWKQGAALARTLGMNVDRTIV